MRILSGVPSFVKIIWYNLDMAKAELFQKDIPEEERVFYYADEEDDPIETKEQEAKIEVGLPENYQFIPKNPLRKAYSSLLFHLFKLFGQYYERGYWQAKFYGREKLKEARGTGYVIYANHTNPFHDVFGPAVMADSCARPSAAAATAMASRARSVSVSAAAPLALSASSCA